MCKRKGGEALSKWVGHNVIPFLLHARILGTHVPDVFFRPTRSKTQTAVSMWLLAQ